ncbi:MAG: imidazole glycerol-phosphate synthase subunit HisF [Actinomycetota bacterium]
MLKVRVIPTLLYRDFGLVKGVQFDAWRHVGSPMQAIKVYNMRGVDELVFLDVAASPADRSPDFDLIDDLADDCFMPMAVGGGVRSVDDVRRLLQVGADKVVIGTASVASPEVVDEASRRFGSQCVVVAIDTAAAADGRVTVRVRCGREDTGRDPVAFAQEIEARGAGEILLTSIDRDGTMTGYDLETLADVCGAVSIPVIASGGAGTYDDMVAALTDGGASAVAAASMFHFTEQTPMEAKLRIRECGFPVRV